MEPFFRFEGPVERRARIGKCRRNRLVASESGTIRTCGPTARGRSAGQVNRIGTEMWRSRRKGRGPARGISTPTGTGPAGARPAQGPSRSLGTPRPCHRHPVAGRGPRVLSHRPPQGARRPTGPVAACRGCPERRSCAALSGAPGFRGRMRSAGWVTGRRPIPLVDGQGARTGRGRSVAHARKVGRGRRGIGRDCCQMRNNRGSESPYRSPRACHRAVHAGGWLRAPCVPLPCHQCPMPARGTSKTVARRLPPSPNHPVRHNNIRWQPQLGPIQLYLAAQDILPPRDARREDAWCMTSGS